MCRFALYVGPPVRLASLVTEPSHSLIHQSFHSDERSEPLNGDGFGVGWYAPRLTPEPARFRAITPAWNNQNLASFAKVVTSPCVVAHIRAASPGSEVNLANTHPFAFRNYLLMHNGHVGAVRRIRRPLQQSLSDEAFEVICGSTDTELIFATFVDEVIRDGSDTPATEGESDAPLVLARFLTRGLARVLEFVRDFGDGASSYLNVAVTDGKSAAISRFSDDPKWPPETLYVLCGELYEPVGRRFAHLRKSEAEGEATLVSSERLTEDPRWKTVPPNHVVVVDRWSPPRVLPMDQDGRLSQTRGPIPLADLSEGPPTPSSATNP